MTQNDDVFRKPENPILAFQWCHTAYDVIMTFNDFNVIPTATSHNNPTN